MVMPFFPPFNTKEILFTLGPEKLFDFSPLSLLPVLYAHDYLVAGLPKWFTCTGVWVGVARVGKRQGRLDIFHITSAFLSSPLPGHVSGHVKYI